MPKELRTYRFTVTGHGHFPVDMLRYDRCWPRTETDSPWILERSGHSRRVNLEGLSAPTIARWASFGWEAKV